MFASTVSFAREVYSVDIKMFAKVGEKFTFPAYWKPDILQR